VYEDRDTDFFSLSKLIPEKIWFSSSWYALPCWCRHSNAN